MQRGFKSDGRKEVTSIIHVVDVNMILFNPYSLHENNIMVTGFRLTNFMN